MTQKPSDLSAVRYLEELQRDVYADMGLERPPELGEDAQQRLLDQAADAMGVEQSDLSEQMRAQLARALVDRPTRFEDPFTFLLLEARATDLEEVAEEIGAKLVARPVLGTLPHGQFNALAIEVPGATEHLVVFHRGVFGLINLVAKAVAATLPPTDPKHAGVSFDLDRERVMHALRRDGTPAQRLADFLVGYILAGHPHAAEQYFLRQPSATLAALLARGGQLFVLGHEYGHIVAGHLEHSAHSERRLGPRSVDVLRPDWRLEYEADDIGMRFALASLRTKSRLDLALSYCGIDLVFSALALVERALATLIHGAPAENAGSDTHPPPALRRNVLRSRVGELPDCAAVSGALTLSANVEAVLELMWTRIEPIFVRLHAEGTPPSPIW